MEGNIAHILVGNILLDITQVI